VIPFGWSFVVIVAFGDAIHALAVRLRMVPARRGHRALDAGDKPDAFTA
jgi:hypothetical protein